MDIKQFQDLQAFLEKEVRSLRGEITSRENKITIIQEFADALKDHLQDYKSITEYQDKFEEINVKYEQERDRLEKLYHQYIEIKSENEQQRDVLKGWEHWFNSNKTLVDKLFSTGPPVEEVMPEEPIPNENKSSKKKKGRFKR